MGNQPQQPQQQSSGCGKMILIGCVVLVIGAIVLVVGGTWYVKNKIQQVVAKYTEEQPRELEEWAQEEKDRDILIRLEDRETEELRRIQSALQLIDRGDYGTCQACGKQIPRERLEELPTAFRCIDCST